MIDGCSGYGVGVWVVVMIGQQNDGVWSMDQLLDCMLGIKCGQYDGKIENMELVEFGEQYVQWLCMFIVCIVFGVADV